MKTSAISQRVADFLKQHPPFDFMNEEDLLALAGGGRVKFHESGEFVIWQGKAPAQHVFVIQQGTVTILEESGNGERLCDIRSRGDLLGVERFFGCEAWPHSAKTSSDVILYALDARQFEPLLEKYPRGKRYLEVHAAVDSARDVSAGVPIRSSLAVGFTGPEPLTCLLGDEIREVARRMSSRDAPAIAVVDRRGAVTGIVTARQLCGHVATGDISPSAPIESLNNGVPATVSPGLPASEYALAMIRSTHGALAITEDGSTRGGLLGLLFPRDLDQFFGDNPVELIRRVAVASGVDELRLLHLRFRAVFATLLTGPETVSWLGPLAGEFNTVMLRRLLEVDRAAGRLAGIKHCWLFYGAGGRGELLAPVAPRVGLIYEDGGGEAKTVQESLAALCGRIHDGFVSCGYSPRTARDGAGNTACASLTGWREWFTGWIHDPVLKRLYDHRPCFDLRVAAGNPDLLESLSDFVIQEIQAREGFVHLLAHDSLANVPPLTFYRGLVVEEGGGLTGELHISRNAIRPLVDVGRALGLAAGRPFNSSSSERFAAAGIAGTGHQGLLEDSTEALQVALFYQAREAARRFSDGAILDPATLSRYDQQLLKRSFRTILRLLEFGAAEFSLENL